MGNQTIPTGEDKSKKGKTIPVGRYVRYVPACRDHPKWKIDGCKSHQQISKLTNFLRQLKKYMLA